MHAVLKVSYFALQTSAADVFAQKVVEGREEIDWKRHQFFLAFGFGYLGCFQFYLYSHLFVRWGHSITHRMGARITPFVLTFLDQGIQYVHTRSSCSMPPRVCCWPPSPLPDSIPSSCPRSHPFLYFPAFYGFKSYMEGKSQGEAMKKCWKENWDNCVALWAIWVCGMRSGEGNSQICGSEWAALCRSGDRDLV